MQNEEIKLTELKTSLNVDHPKKAFWGSGIRAGEPQWMI
jgi:hypothetical protein